MNPSSSKSFITTGIQRQRLMTPDVICFINKVISQVVWSKTELKRLPCALSLRACQIFFFLARHSFPRPCIQINSNVSCWKTERLKNHWLSNYKIKLQNFGNQVNKLQGYSDCLVSFFWTVHFFKIGFRSAPKKFRIFSVANFTGDNEHWTKTRLRCDKAGHNRKSNYGQRYDEHEYTIKNVQILQIV